MFVLKIISDMCNRAKEWLLEQRYIYGLVQDCSISSALVMEILQSSTKPSISIIAAVALLT